MKKLGIEDIEFTPLMEKVIGFVTEKFIPLTRQDGITPYFIHLWRVAWKAFLATDSRMKELAFIVGLLHDIFEDTNTTEEELVELGVSDYIIKRVHALTKTKNESYLNYLYRVKNDSCISGKIKILDIVDNLLDTPTQGQIEKYTLTLLYLAGCIGAEGLEKLGRKK